MGLQHHHHHRHKGHEGPEPDRDQFSRGYGRHKGPGGTVPRALFRALMVTLIFMVVELTGGYLANSLALISDGAHMLTDVGAILLSLFAYWMACRPSTPTMSFGYHRAEILGALVSGLAIWLLAGVLAYEAALRLQNPPPVEGPVVFGIAVLGLFANLISMRMLHSSKKESINVRAAYLHLLADSLGSISAVVAGLVLWLTDWRPIDPIVTFVFSGLMLIGSWELVRESVGVLMESTPRGVNPDQIQRDLEKIDRVQQVHDLHVWSVSSGRVALSVHLITTDTEKVLASAHGMLQQRYGIIHTTIQVEHPDKFDSDRCYDCANA